MVGALELLKVPMIMLETSDVKKCTGCTEKYKEYKSREKLRSDAGKAERQALEQMPIISCSTSFEPHATKKHTYVMNLELVHEDEVDSCENFVYEKVYKLYALMLPTAYSTIEIPKPSN